MNLLLIPLPLLMIVYLLYPRISLKLNKNVINVSGDEAVNLIKEHRDLVILDVRNRNEYKTGHINGSKLMPVNELPSKIAELEKFRGKPILVHCASGGRSPKAVRFLLKNKFTPIYHMNHGLADFNGRLKK